MKEEKYFFGKLTRKVPQTAWEADYIVKRNFDNTLGGAIFIFFICLVLILSTIMVLFYSTQQCSADFEIEGKGAIELTKNKLEDTPLKNFELNEGKVKVSATIPCYYLSRWG